MIRPDGKFWAPGGWNFRLNQPSSEGDVVYSPRDVDRRRCAGLGLDGRWLDQDSGYEVHPESHK
jgi:hypothetical protein